MKAIETRYVGPGNRRGSRIIASDSDGNRVIIPYPYELSGEQGHLKAAQRLMQKMGWTGTLHGGGTKRGYCFVFTNSARRMTLQRNPRHRRRRRASPSFALPLLLLGGLWFWGRQSGSL